jgi:RNA polymerase sigma factor (sigma-70 family)
VEASALPAPAAVARTRPSIGTPLLRLRSDEQLVALFRAGHDEAFRVIHDRYRQRLFAYTRQMLTQRQDAEDALQDIFVRAYSGLRANRRELALRAWLYRVAHNRCIDELRRPAPPPPVVMELMRSPVHDPIAEADQRESLRRLIADVRRLPDQQRSALLMRELGGMSYADMAGALGVTVPAVKSLLVRARLALAQALEARDTACSKIREELILSHDRGLRPNATARRHMRDCDGCQEFRHQLRGVSRRFAAIVPTLGPLGVLANMLGIGGAGSGAAGGALAASGVAGSGSAVVGVGALSAGATHVATILAAAVVTAGGAVELQQTIPMSHHSHRSGHAAVIAPVSRPAARSAGITSSATNESAEPNQVVSSPTQVQVTHAVGGSTSSTDPAPAKPKPLTSTTTSVRKRTTPSTGGISAVKTTGGASVSDPAKGIVAPTDSRAASPTSGSSSASATTSPPAASAPGDTSSSTPSATSTPVAPTSGASTSTGSSSTGASTSTGSSTSSSAGSGSSSSSAPSGPPAPPQ